MRYRIEDGQVVEYARIHANATISRADNTFGFCPIQFHEDFSVFSTDANSAMDKVKAAQVCVLPMNANAMMPFTFLQCRGLILRVSRMHAVMMAWIAYRKYQQENVICKMEKCSYLSPASFITDWLMLTTSINF
jgi:chloramphenicol O-acetyltransferase